MSATNRLLTEDQFLCSICLDVFTDPVTIPCGHNFCKKCIMQHWSTDISCQCPICNKVFDTRPELHVNTFISAMADQFRQSATQKTTNTSSISEQQVSKPVEVSCDVCTGTKLKAMKSCLVCLTSYCETHLEPHVTAPSLKRHQLTDPVENMESRVCTTHGKLLELFCKTDHTVICMLCTVLDHKAHEVVPLKEEYERKKSDLGRKEREMGEMIEKRRLKIQEIKKAIELSNESADKEIAGGVQIFSALKESVERDQTEFIDTVRERQRKTEEEAKGFISELEQEISELKMRSAEVEHLSRSEDHLQLLQGFQSLNAAPATKDWANIKVNPPSYEENVTQAEEMLSKQVKKVFSEAKMRRFQQYAVDVTLDPDTANPKLILSDDGKQVYHSNVTRNLPDTPKRFDYCNNVLARESFSSGKFYFEVQVKGKTKWTLGVVRESINRKGHVTMSPQNGFFGICKRNENDYRALDGTDRSVPLKSAPEKVGVFVDFEGRKVSFIDASAAVFICSFNNFSLTQKMVPFFNPGPVLGGKNSAPLIICSVDDSQSFEVPVRSFKPTVKQTAIIQSAHF